MLDASVPFPTTTVPVVEPMYENKRRNPPSRMTMPDNQPEPYILHCVEWMVECDSDARSSTCVALFCCIQNAGVHCR